MYQLFVDGSQGALSLLALFPPLAVLVDQLIRQPRAAHVILIALLLAGGFSVYEAGMPTIVVWAAVVVAVLGVAAAAERRLRRDAVWKAVKIATAIAIVTIASAPIAFGRAVDFYLEYLANQFDTAGIPYKLPVEVIPSWLFQSQGTLRILGERCHDRLVIPVPLDRSGAGGIYLRRHLRDFALPPGLGSRRSSTNRRGTGLQFVPKHRRSPRHISG